MIIDLSVKFFLIKYHDLTYRQVMIEYTANSIHNIRIIPAYPNGIVHIDDTMKAILPEYIYTALIANGYACETLHHVLYGLLPLYKCQLCVGPFVKKV